MQEDLKENFILLSKIAKEKKYAQEYLGLLARRGDIGSIRIGKRWYTTWQWFEEFLENSQKKKSECLTEAQIVQTAKVGTAASTMEKLVEAVPVKVETLKFIESEELIPVEFAEKEPVFVPLSGATAGEVKINIPFVFQEKEKVLVAQSAVNIQTEEKVSNESAKIPVAVKTKGEGQIIRNDVSISRVEIKKVNPLAMPVRNSAPVRIAIQAKKINETRERKIDRIQVRTTQSVNRFEIFNRNQFPPKKSNFGNISIEERNKFAIPYKETKVNNKAGVFSPDISGEERETAPLFPRFAFAIGFAIILLLVAVSGYLVYSGGMLGKGRVAGASDERNAGFSGIQAGSENVLTSASDKIVESVSVSRVMMEAARERGNQGN